MKIILAYFFHLRQVGGVEHVLITFANEMVNRNHEVTILYASPTLDKPRFDLDSRVKLVNLMKNNRYPKSKMLFSKSIPIWARGIRKCLYIMGANVHKDWNFYWMNRTAGMAIRECICDEKPSVIVSFNTITNGLIVKNIKNIPLITMFHIMPEWEIESSCSTFEKKALNCNDAVQVLLNGNLKYMNERLNLNNVLVIPNAIKIPTVGASIEKCKKKYHIVEVARLHKEDKRQDYVIEAFSKIADKYPDWVLDFWGKESSPGYENELKKMIEQKKLNNRIFLHGPTKDIESVYTSADIFCFPSLREGFGLALVEAMSYGVPTIAMKDCVASREILEDGKCGWLIENNIKALSDALEYFINNQDIRVKYGVLGKKQAKKFDSEKVWGAWESLLLKVSKK